MSRTRKGSKGPGWEPWSNLRERQEQKADYREPEENRATPAPKPFSVEKARKVADAFMEFLCPEDKDFLRVGMTLRGACNEIDRLREQLANMADAADGVRLGDMPEALWKALDSYKKSKT